MKKTGKKMKNLLELCLSPDLGGLELYMYRCACALKADFRVISVIAPEGKLVSYFKEEEHLFIQKSSNILMLRAAKKLAAIIDSNDIDLLHLHWTKDIPIAVLAKKFSKKKPHLIQTRNMTMTRFKDDFYHRFLYKNITLMLPVTYQVKEQLERFIPEDIRPKIEVVYMGSDKVELLNDAAATELKNSLNMNTTFNIAMVGRIEEAKGQYLLIDALQKLKAQNLNIKAYFVGHAMEETYLKALQKKVTDTELEANVEFVGFMKNPHHLMQVSDAVVLATPCETFGLVLIEAMLVQTAIIGTDRCGPLEIIEANKSGLLFENKNSDSLARQISHLYNDPSLKEQLAKSGYERVNELFSNKKQFQKLANALSTI
jgi:L-malate glycosyltransferase